MSIVSDIKGLFSQTNSGATDFYLSGYPTPSLATQLNIYAVEDISNVQQNAVTVKPIEAGTNSTQGTGYTSDSVQIKPYVITIRGMLYPDLDFLPLTYQDISDYVAQQIAQIRIWQNSTNLFTLSNLFSFGTYSPLKLTGLAVHNNTDMTIPEVTLTFTQIQVTNANSYNTTNNSSSGTQAQAQNNDVIQGN
jgi:hypothetical protein